MESLGLSEDDIDELEPTQVGKKYRVRVPDRVLNKLGIDPSEFQNRHIRFIDVPDEDIVIIKKAEVQYA